MTTYIYPFKQDWYKNVNDPWIKDNINEIEHAFYKIWWEVYRTLGSEAACSMDIVGFSRFKSQKKMYFKLKESKKISSQSSIRRD